MRSHLRRYWPVIPIAAVFAAGVFFEWTSANGPHPPSYAAAPQIPALAPPQSPAPSAGEPRGPANTDAEHRAETANTNQPASKKLPLFVRVLPAADAPGPAAKKTESHNAETPPDWGLVIPTWVLAFATVGLFIYTAKLWSSTSTLVGEERKNSERQLRAYVYFDGPKSRNWPPAPAMPNRLSVTIDVVNGGSTWARKLSVQSVVVRNPPADPFDAFDWKAHKPKTNLLGPGQRISLQFGDIDFLEMARIRDGQMTVHLVAIAQYWDAFSAMPRQTRISRQLLVDSENGHSFAYNPTHNCADEDCAAI